MKNLQNQKTIRWGIIGPGRIAVAFAKGIAQVEDAEIYAVASRDSVRGQEFAKTWGIPKVYSNYDDLYQDAEVDAIYIATPHTFHYEQTLAALKHGKPVLCEKPLTVFPSDTEKLVSYAQKNGTFLMEALWSRFLPGWKKIKEIITAGRIGKIRAIESSFGFYREYTDADRVFNASLAGGALLDIGIYNLGLTHYILGEAKSWQVQGHLAPTGVDETVHGFMEYANGAIASFTCSTRMALPNTMSISGDRGIIEVPSHLIKPHSFTINEDGSSTNIDVPFESSGFQFEIAAAQKALREGKIETEEMPHTATLYLQHQMGAILNKLGVQYPFKPAAN